MNANNTQFKNLLTSHIEKYPLMNTCDALKLAYQSVFGAAHLCSDFEGVKRSIEEEFSLFEELSPKEFFSSKENSFSADEFIFTNEKSVSADGSFFLNKKSFSTDDENALFENIGQYSRLNLRHPEIRALGADIVAKLFMYSAREDFAKIGDPLCISRFEEAVSLFSKEKAELSAPSHSPEYKAAYKPSYRVVSNKYLRALPLIAEIAKRPKNSVFTVAVDGDCASGKSTLAKLLKYIFNCPVIKMDDFFLPFERKTPERLSEAGGNIDYERFNREVSPYIKEGKNFTYKAYGCTDGSYREITVPDFSLIIVEGVYSQTPKLQNGYDLRVFSEISRKKQLERLEKRSPKLLDRFVKEWIPMEKKYFEAFDIKSKCHIILR